jgi:methylglutaconyl-CoA hydratase
MPPRRSCDSRILSALKPCRFLYTAPVTPHAYLRPLVQPSSEPGAEELEGTVCLVLDRKEARNALSVQMVQVGCEVHMSLQLMSRSYERG